MAWFHGRGHPVTGVDRDTAFAQALEYPGTLVEADIEAGPWPLQTEARPTQFGAVVVTNYLWRALWPTVLDSVAAGGVLLYETFAVGNETLGRPSRPDFLLQPGELLDRCRGWHVVAYENGTLENPARCVQRIAAIRPAPLPLPDLPDSDTDLARKRYPL